jgi:hypothetical protein
MLQHRSRTNNLYDRPLRHATRRGEMRRQGSSSPLPRGGGGEENTSSCLGNGSSGELPTTHPTTNTLHLTPFTHTLHPTPYTLQPTPCTLHSHPKPYTRHPTPDTLHPTLTPQTLHPAPYTIHPTPHMTRLGRRTPQAAQGMDQAGNSRPPTPHPTSYTLHPTPFTHTPTPYTLHPAPDTLHPTPYTRTRHHTPYTIRDPAGEENTSSCPGNRSSGELPPGGRKLTLDDRLTFGDPFQDSGVAALQAAPDRAGLCACACVGYHMKRILNENISGCRVSGVGCRV